MLSAVATPVKTTQNQDYEGHRAGLLAGSIQEVVVDGVGPDSSELVAAYWGPGPVARDAIHEEGIDGSPGQLGDGCPGFLGDSPQGVELV